MENGNMIRDHRIVIILAALGILLRAIPIWIMPIWYDEAFTVLVARLPLASLFAATAGDVHPPLWYLICWPLAHLSFMPSWLVIRLPALIASIASIWIWWKILQISNLSPSTKLLAFGLFCFIPEQIYYAQEGRMYSLLTMLVLASWLCILERRWILLVVCSISMVWLHNYGLIYAAVLWIAAVIHNRSGWIKYSIAIGIGALSFIPWAIVLLHQMQSINGSYWIMRFSIPSVLGDLLHSFFGNMDLKQDIINFAVFYGLLLWVLIWCLRNRKLNYPALVIAFLPALLAAGISLIWQPIMLWRALIPSGPFIGLLLVTPLEHLSIRANLLIGTFVLPALVANLVNIMFRYQWDAANIREHQAIDIVDANWKSGDLLYYSDDGTFVIGSIDWAHIDKALRSQPCGIIYGGLSQNTRSSLGMEVGALPDDYPGRIWVITSETPLSPQCQMDYLIAKGLINSAPLFCSNDTELVRSCLYLSNP
jgi:hypothetical protein